MFVTLLIGAAVAIFVVLIGTSALSYALFAEYKKPGRRERILLGVEFIYLIPTAILLGGLLTFLSQWLAVGLGWSGNLLNPIIGGVLGGAILVLFVIIANRRILNTLVKNPSSSDRAVTTLILDGRGEVEDMDLSPSEDLLASSSSYHAVYIWNVKTGEMTLMIEPEGNQDEVHSVCWSPHGQLLAAGLHDGQIKVWEARTGGHLLTLTGHSLPVRSLAWSPSGDKLASGSIDETAIIWDTESGMPVTTLRHEKGVSRLAWSSNGMRFATAASDGTVIVWDTQASKSVAKLESHTSAVLSVAWSPELSMLATAAKNGTIILWDTHTWQPLRTLAGHTDRVGSVTWSPDASYLASSSDDQTVVIWDAKTGQRLVNFEGNPYSQNNFVFWSRDGKTVFSSWGYRLFIWDVSSLPCLGCPD